MTAHPEQLPRPSPLQALPFRVVQYPGGAQLEYADDVELCDGTVRRIPFWLRSIDKPFKQITRLMEMYRELEHQVDRLRAERDEALATHRDEGEQWRAERKSLTARVVELERELKAAREPAPVKRKG